MMLSLNVFESEKEKLLHALLKKQSYVVIGENGIGKRRLVEDVFQRVISKQKKTVVIAADLFFCRTANAILQELVHQILVSTGLSPLEIRKKWKADFPPLILREGRFVLLEGEELRYIDGCIHFINKHCLNKSCYLVMMHFEKIFPFLQSPEISTLLINLKKAKIPFIGLTASGYTYHNHIRPSLYKIAKQKELIIYPEKAEQWKKQLTTYFNLKKIKLKTAQIGRLIESFGRNTAYTLDYCEELIATGSKQPQEEEMQLAFFKVITKNEAYFKSRIEALSNTQMNLLIAISKNVSQLTSVKAMQFYELGTPHNVAKNKISLLEANLIHSEGKVVKITDSCFQQWIHLNRW